MQRQVTKIYRNGPFVNNGEILAYRLLPTNNIESIGPFVFIDSYSTTAKRGLGQEPHPHAGIEVLSYLFKGHGEHRDSRGFVDRIKGGEAQHIKAGRGILHAETPLEAVRQGLQLWLSLPPENLFDDPTYAAYRATAIPTFDLGSAQVKVVAGNLNEHKGPVTTVNESFLVHVELKDKNEVTLDVDESIELGVFVVNGQASVSENSLSIGDIAIMSSGNKITIKAEGTDFPVDIAILGGTKINYPLVFHGPFVMNSVENIRRAYESYHNGSMGQLN